MELHEWTKKLGQQHWYRQGENETLCGRPLLGNNYAKYDIKKTPCEKCMEVKEA